MRSQIDEDAGCERTSRATVWSSGILLVDDGGLQAGLELDQPLADQGVGAEARLAGLDQLLGLAELGPHNIAQLGQRKVMV